MGFQESFRYKKEVARKQLRSVIIRNKSFDEKGKRAAHLMTIFFQVYNLDGIEAHTPLQ